MGKIQQMDGRILITLFSLKLAKFPLVTYFLKMVGFLNKAQIDYIEWNKKNKIIFADAIRYLPFEDNEVDVIYTSHMLEHLSPKGAIKFLLEAKRTLRAGGVLRISVPDLKNMFCDILMMEIIYNFMKNLYQSWRDKFTQRQTSFSFYWF